MIKKLWNELFLLEPPSEQFVLKTKYPAATCLQMLRENMDQERGNWFFPYWGSGNKPLIGKIWGMEFYVRWRSYLRSDFSPYFFGIIVDDPAGARVVGVFDMDRYAKNFLRLWVGIVLSFAAIMLLGFLLNVATGGFNLTFFILGFVVTSLLLVSGYVLPRLGLAVSKGQEQRIISSLEAILMSRAVRQV